MKLLNVFCAFAFALFFVAVAHAADVVPPSTDELAALIASLGGLKGASALAIAAVVVQGIMLVIRTKLGEMAGKWRLTIMYALTVAAAVIAQRIAGLDLGAALMHSNTLAALQVLAHQVLVQFFKKEE